MIDKIDIEPIGASTVPGGFQIIDDPREGYDYHRYIVPYTAIPAEGYHFKEWRIEGVSGKESAPTPFTYHNGINPPRPEDYELDFVEWKANSILGTRIHNITKITAVFEEQHIYTDLILRDEITGKVLRSERYDQILRDR